MSVIESAAASEGQKDLEALQDGFYGLDKDSEAGQEEPKFSALVKAYARGDVALLVQLIGNVWRDGVEGPPKHFCLSYQWSRKKGLLFEPIEGPRRPKHKTPPGR